MNGSFEKRNAVVYQIYPRSFQDSNGDGIGDIPGITSRLPHFIDLGVDAIWLSPIYPSPNADFGYDISDHTAIDPAYGTLDDFDQLINNAHNLGLSVLLDYVPNHTSIEHPWFREHPDWYIWSPVDGPPNNWCSVFGGPAWSRDDETGRWYLHSYYKEQPDLNWRNPEVVDAMHHVLTTWRDRGVDGFRIDAIRALFKDEQLRDNPSPEMSHADLEMKQKPYTSNLPEVFDALAGIRRLLPDSFLVVEASVPTRFLARYTENVDLAFSFEFLQAPLDVARVRSIVTEAMAVPGVAWVLSNHDFSRLVSRWGRARALAAATLLLTLPGAAFIYQGDEIGMVDGPGGPVKFDRLDRDLFRHPMQWTPAGGFTATVPWLPMVDPNACNVEDQLRDPSSVLSNYKALLRLRSEMHGPLHFLPSMPELLAYERDEHIVVINLETRDILLDPQLDGLDEVFRSRQTPVRISGSITAESALILKKADISGV